MKHMTSKMGLALFALTIGVAGSIGTSVSAAEKLLRIRLNADIRSSEPGVNRDANTDIVVPHIVEGLVAYQEDASIGNLLAESVSVSEDGKRYTFKLRPGVTFHDGSKLTAQDVLFSWDRYTDPKKGWRCLPDVNGETGLAHVTKVDAAGDDTVVFQLEKPSALFLSILARPDCAGTGIYSKSSLDASGNWLKPVGTGPFKWTEWKKGQYVELDKFDGYRALPGTANGYAGNKTPLVDKVRFEIIPDDSATKAALLSGGLEVIWDVANADVKELSTTKGITLGKADGMGVVTYNFQTLDPLLSDRRIRKAIELALDQRQIVETVSEGLAVPNRSIIPTPSAYHREIQAEVPQRNLDEARRLLAEAGYRGEQITWITTKHFPILFDTAVLAQAMLQEAGINVKIEVMDWATHQDRYNAGKFQAISMSYSARLDPSLSYDMMSGDKAKQPRKVWDNPEAQKLITQSTVTVDRKQRQAIFDQLEKMFRDDVPMIVLYSGVKVSAVGENVKGFKGWAFGFPRAWGVSLADSQ
jgi:peptide/nickel transport system substrate-binding protein